MPKLFESADDFTNLFTIEGDQQNDPNEQEKVIK
jgi:hypothetical protein